MEKQHFIVVTPADFTPVIQQVLKQVKEQAGGVVCLEGDLGAGKTTFVQALAAQLGVTEPVTSPTFGIMKTYEVPEGAAVAILVHIDAYRIEDSSEAGPLRLQELWQQPRTLVCIEWPERIQDILPKERIEISLEITKDENRTVWVKY